MHGNLLEGEKKPAQFIVVLYILQQAWKPMNGHKPLRPLFYFFQIKNFPKKHYCDNTSQTMVKIMHDIVINAPTKAISLTKQIAMSCDEVINVDKVSLQYNEPLQV